VSDALAAFGPTAAEGGESEAQRQEGRDGRLSGGRATGAATTLASVGLLPVRLLVVGGAGRRRSRGLAGRRWGAASVIPAVGRSERHRGSTEAQSKQERKPSHDQG